MRGVFDHSAGQSGSRMMIFSTAFLSGQQFAKTTVCIVGGGAAGITLACELDGTGIDVLLLEAGGSGHDQRVHDDYAGAATFPHPDTTEFRRTGFGGTTTIWGGRCVPLDPIDFTRRQHIPDSGWPIAYEEVAGYYPKAMRYCDAGHADFSVAGSLGAALPTIDGLESDATMLADRIERYSCPTDFGKRYRARLARSSNVTVLLFARCIRLVRDADKGRIEQLVLVDRAGRRVCVHADTFVLAGGGLEVTRLLLDSDTSGPGLGNRHDKLGRYYACHAESICARLVPGHGKLPFAFEKTLDGVYARRKLQFSDAAQHRHRLLNSAFRLHFPPYADARHGSAVMSTIYMAKSALLPEHARILHHGVPDTVVSPRRAHLRNIASGLPHVAAFGMRWLFLRKFARRKLPYTLVPNADGSYPLEFNCEQTPLPASRVSLLRERDRHGMRRIQVDWRLAREDVEAACRGFIVLRDALRRSSSCRLEFDEARLHAALENATPLGGHHMGTVRMGASPKDGVVDRNCALFELPNLYIASAAVFPTPGHANPTLTIVALAIRLATHLRAGRTFPATAMTETAEQP